VRRPVLEERIAWLDTFPKRMTVGALLKALRIVAEADAKRSITKPKEA
jgi:hypothetical protein